MKKQSQLKSDTKAKRIGIPLMSRQVSVVSASSGSVVGSGSARPVTRQIVIPRMTPKLVVKSNVEDHSTGTVSFK